MIKKSTLIVLLVAILGGGAVYYFDWQRGQKEAAKAAEDTSKPVFNLQSGDISSLTISYPADAKSQAIQLEKHGDTWDITHPIETGADEPSVQGIVEELATARVSQTEPGAPDRLKAYGLEPPGVLLDFGLKNGTKHRLKLGKKDFTGVSVYALADNGKDVALLPESLLVSVDKPLQELRDRAVLHIASDQVNSFELKNAAGEVVAAKGKDGDWRFSKPAPTAADTDAISSLLTTVANAKMVTIANETAEKLGSYGLASPLVTFTATDARGKAAILLVGKKEGDEYFARDASRPTIFRINQDLYKKLAENYSDLRDKRIVQFDPANISHVEIHNANGTIVLTRKDESEWTFDAPAEKGKSANAEKLFTPLQLARAEEIFDHPAGDVAAKLNKPEFEATLTDKSGKKIAVQISKAVDGFVYARSSEGPAIYKLKSQILTDLDFKPADMAF